MELSSPRLFSLPALLTRLANARFFTISALIHILIVLLFGGTVLFKRFQEPPDFEAGDGALVNETVAPAPPQPPAPTMPTEQFQPPVAAMAAPITPAITTMNTTSNFQMQVPVAVPTMKAVDSSQMANALSKSTQTGASSLAPSTSGGRGSAFGQREKVNQALTGTFFDLKQTRGHRPTKVTPEEYGTIYRKFVDSGWDESVLNEYYRAPKQVYTSQVFIPNMSATEGPKAFGVEKLVQPSRWLVLYKGRVAPPLTGTYHFVGAGDDVMIVRFNGKVVLDRCWFSKDAKWHAEKNYNYDFSKIPNGFARGDALKLTAGQFYDIEILIGEQPGGEMFATLLSELEGIEYRKDSRGNPILPVFRVANQPVPTLESGQTLPPYEPDGPVWQVAPEGSNLPPPSGL